MRVGFGIKILLLTAAVLLALKIVHHRFGRRYNDAHIEKAYHSFKLEFGKKATTEEEKYRYQVFRANYKRMEKHNADSSQTTKMGINQFSDMSHKEFVHTVLMAPIEEATENFIPHLEASKIPKSGIDWRTKGVIGPVQNQGTSGACWAFGSICSIESAYMIKGKKVSLSVQQLIDCASDSVPGVESALKFAKQQGLVTSSEYPITGRKGTCKKEMGPYKISSQRMIDNTPAALKEALALGPVVTQVDASSWTYYRSGVFTGCKPNPVLNHVVLIVGYEDTYWIVKNSWGVSWGERGYIRLDTGANCGIHQKAYIPTV